MDIGNRTGPEYLAGAAPARPIGGGITQMLRDEPRFGSFPPHVLFVLGWCYRYIHEPVPTRDDIMRAMHALASGANARYWTDDVLSVCEGRGEGIVTASALSLAFIHPSAWKQHSPNFAYTAF